MRVSSLWIALFVLGCSASRPTVSEEAGSPVVGEEWFSWRAQTLELTLEEARARDAALPDGSDGAAVPSGTLDEHTRAQADLLWRQECARCHGEHGEPPPVRAGEVQPRAWTGMGPTMGFLFGGDAMRAGIYKTISEGKGTMAGWGDALSREQIWALVAHIEDF